MRRPVTKLGKVGNMVWGKNRHGQTYYALVVSSNPRTEPQQGNRHSFGGTGPTWGHLTDDERDQWRADARHYRTHGRPGSRRVPMTGFQRYMSVNVKRAREGLPPLRVPPSPICPPPSAICHLASAIPHSPPPFRASAYILQPLAFPHGRAPMHSRSQTLDTPLVHRCTLLSLRRTSVVARAGPGPPRLLSLDP